MKYIFYAFAVSLAATLVIEWGIALCFGLRSRNQLILVTLVNILTNPAAVWLHVFLGIPQIPVEIAVVIIECYVYHQFEIPKPLLFSLLANGISWGLGVLIQAL